MRSLKTFGLAAPLILIVVATDALSHGLAEPGGASLAWTFDPWIVAPLSVSALLFIVGWARLRARSQRTGDRWQKRAVLFASGWGVLAIALLSPLHSAGERSFTAHMLEHELLMLLAAPLLVLAEPLVIMLWALPLAVRRLFGGMANSGAISRLWAWARQPFTATGLQAAGLWLWHAPVLFDLALAHDGWHIAQHLTFLVSALVFWTAMLNRSTRRADASVARSVAALCLFVTSVVSGALGGLMAMSQSPWYAGYARLGMAPFGLTPAEDQQLAGLLMWIPGGLVHAVVALMLVRSLIGGTQPEPGRRNAS